ncbi:MAG: hypothetical protein AAGB93_01475 [Planctomycetota bacterium]
MRRLALPLLAAALAPAALAQTVVVTSDIATSTTWTADNVYDLRDLIFVLPGATLTIEPGTVIASASGAGGSLVVARGAQIFVLGERGAPVIMTSDADLATWTNGDPRTGVWRESASEWGTLAVLGEAYISTDRVPTNTPFPSPGNFGNLAGPTSGNVLARYGGGNDDDDSGALRFLSLRYGGQVAGLNDEFDGLTLAGVGRGTDVDHVEVMNNVDDGIGILGGTVDLRHFSVWNVGDDSLDVDQGWRGKAQFGLIVQGHSLNSAQGSGVGDNAIELDGAEAPFYQPVTTATIYNLTVIGQPADGDGLTAWRDNARVQLRNSIFMDGGEQVVRLDENLPGTGYGAMATLDWPTTWQTPFSVFPTVNAPPNPGDFYRAQTSGRLIEFTGNVFFRNEVPNAYTEAIARGVFAPGNRNVLATSSPVASMTRGAALLRGGKLMLPVLELDPRPANDALIPAGSPPVDGFFTDARYRGAFSPAASETWLCGWTASEAFGFTTSRCVGRSFCSAEPNSTGQRAEILASGSADVSVNDVTLIARDLPRDAFGFFLVSRDEGFVANPGGSTGNLCLGGAVGRFVGPGQIRNAGAAGTFELTIDLGAIPQPTGSVQVAPGDAWSFQAWFRDASGGVATSNLTNGVTVDFD